MAEMMLPFPFPYEGNDCLIIAARSGHEEFMLNVLNRHPTLINEDDSRGDNPLHVAARAGHLGVVQLLIDFFRSSENRTATAEGIPSEGHHPQPIWRIKNNDGSTALHEALRNKHEDIALHLLDLDSELVELAANAKDESPLYLAAKAGFVRVLKKIHDAGRKTNTEAIIDTYKGPNGQTPFHAAVFAKSQESIQVLSWSIAKLINEQDSNGRTALYHATQEDSFEMMNLLLELDATSALIRDNDEGLSPLLIAARKGCSASVLAILQACPESIYLSDNSGQNALHLAVKHNTVKKFERLLYFPKMNSLANKVDHVGNTPLHLAIMEQKDQHVKALLRHTKAKIPDGWNNEKTFDLCYFPGETSNEQRKSLVRIRKALDAASKFHHNLFVMLSRFIGVDERWLGLFQDEGLPQTINTMSVVAALLVTTTSAVVLEIPGGYNSDGSPTLIHTPALKGFIFADTIALCFSTLSLCYLVLASTNSELSPSNITMLLVSGALLISALLSSTVGFICGMYAVTSTQSNWLALLVSSLCISAAICGIFYAIKMSDFLKKILSLKKNGVKSSLKSLVTGEFRS